MVTGRIQSLIYGCFLFSSIVHASLSHEATAVEIDENGATKSLSDGNETTIAGTRTEKDDLPTDSKSDLSEESAATAPLKQHVQSGPLIDLFGQQLLSLEMLDEKRAELRPHLTSDALRGKKVIGVYFSADWCGPCRKFTPELVSFYQKMNKRRGQMNQFEIVWVSRCRDVDAYSQFFTHMGGWVALPPEEAMGKRGTMLSERFKVKGVPSLVLLDDLGEVITLDGRNKIPNDKAGIGFPWRNPLATLYISLIPRSLRLLARSQIQHVKDSLFIALKQAFGRKKAATTRQ